jgi:hypothetical protein
MRTEGHSQTEQSALAIRDERGRFLKGAPGGPGNPQARAISEWRSVLASAVTKQDLRAVIDKLVVQAKAGRQWAVVELLNRCLGRPETASVELPAGTSITFRIIGPDAAAEDHRLYEPPLRHPTIDANPVASIACDDDAAGGAGGCPAGCPETDRETSETEGQEEGTP